MAYKVIPQVEFDKAVQKVLSTGLGLVPAESIVIAFWRASQDLNKDFKSLIEKATASGLLEVEQVILDHMNQNLPDTIRYYKKTTSSIPNVAKREL
jgi:hypothetical protein